MITRPFLGLTLLVLDPAQLFLRESIKYSLGLPWLPGRRLQGTRTWTVNGRLGAAVFLLLQRPRPRRLQSLSLILFLRTVFRLTSRIIIRSLLLLISGPLANFWTLLHIRSRLLQIQIALLRCADLVHHHGQLLQTFLRLIDSILRHHDRFSK